MLAISFLCWWNLTRAEAVFQPPRSFTSLSTAAKCSMLVSEPLRASFCWKEDICSRPPPFFPQQMSENLQSSSTNDLLIVWSKSRCKRINLHGDGSSIQESPIWWECVIILLARPHWGNLCWLGHSHPASRFTSQHIHTRVLFQHIQNHSKLKTLPLTL